MYSLAIYFLIGLLAGTIIHLLDIHQKTLYRVLLFSVIGSFIGVFLSDFLYSTTIDAISLSSLLLAAGCSFFFALLGETILKPAGRHTKAYSQWKSLQKNSPFSSRYQYAYFSDVRQKSESDRGGLNKMLRQIKYPASKRDIVKYAEEHDASAEALSELEKVPDHLYDSVWDVRKKVKRQK